MEVLQPRAIKGVASKPRFLGQMIRGVRLRIADADAYRPVEAGVHIIVALDGMLRRHEGHGVVGDIRTFNRLAGTGRLIEALERRIDPYDIVASWSRDVERFEQARGRYLRY